MSSTTKSAPLRPSSTTGLLSWLATTDHKRIGIMYFWTTLVFFFLGGLEASLCARSSRRPSSGS
jgi:heme/copper-type cytochrome/quinol oxidase subunit 1